MKAHIFRELVNDLRDIATQWHGSQQLRERISRRLYQDVSIDEDPANDGWIPWAATTTSQCPVGQDTWVAVRLANGQASRGGKPHQAGQFFWGVLPAGSIVAYRIVRK